MNKGALAGVGVLITRPREQNEALAALIEGRGGRAYQVPAYEICAAQNQDALDRIGQQLKEFDFVFFVSSTAVLWGCERFGLTENSFASKVKFAAVGASTAAAMQTRNLQVDIVPKSGYDSENLLAMPELERIGNKKVLVVRGEGGREFLAETLRQRGAQVEYAEVYRRRCPQARLGELLTPAQRSDIAFAVATSNEGLQNLYTMAGEELRGWLRALRLVVMSRRAVELARQLGFENDPRVVDLPGNDGIIKTLLEWKNDN